jgi:hypothetical protein
MVALLLAGSVLAAQDAGPGRWQVQIVPAGATEPAPVAGQPAPVDIPAPSLRSVPNDGYAQVTLAPWVESNGWRFQRGIRLAEYRDLPRGMAPLAAAEAFAFGVDAILHPNAADTAELDRVIAFLRAHERPAMPPLANIGLIDDGSLPLGEAMNMLTRRNLLFRIVSAPDPSLAFTVKPDSDEFPRESLRNPNDFAERVRDRLGDDRRLVRIFGSSTVIARLTGDAQHARLVLLSYSRNRTQQDLRIRLLGRYRPTATAAYGAPAGAALQDVQIVDGATEFTIPIFNTVAILDLDVVPSEGATRR